MAEVDSDTVLLYSIDVPEKLSIESLAKRLNAWCEGHGVVPASGQANECVSERNVRYYRTIGLMDAPEGAAYGEKHLLQLTAVRLLQAQGLPLRRIRELLYGRSLEELRELRRRSLVEVRRSTSSLQVTMPSQDELWRAIPLGEDFLLISRRGTPLTPRQREAVLRALRLSSAEPHHESTQEQ